jgi:hypothetical protein
MSFLDNVPLATLVALASIVIIVIGYASNDIDLDSALLALGAVLGGSGVVGIARAQSGKGIRQPPQQ